MGETTSRTGGSIRARAGGDTITTLEALERQVLWLASWTIHNANHVRPSRDGIKVGGHQASSASLATILTALYFHVLRPEDRVAVKPHASPVFHAIQYLMGRQTQENLERFRGFGGAQSYPSRTKDYPEVDFSTGSVGLGVAATLFASLVQDYVRAHDRVDRGAPKGRMIALVGDAELDEGNVYEALLDGWKHDIQNTWWIIDYNRQSLDGVVNDALFKKISGVFDTLGWNVTTLKYGRKLEAIRGAPGGEAVLDWIDKCENQLYSALTFKGGPAWRERLKAEIGEASGVKALLDDHDDASLHALMTNLAGHDMETLVDAFANIGDDPDPQCVIAYTVKGFGLPLAGHKDNHAGLLTPAQMETFKTGMGVAEGSEWEPFSTVNDAAKASGPAARNATNAETARHFIKSAPFMGRPEDRPAPPTVSVPPLPVPPGAQMSTQEAFGKILLNVARQGGAFADAIVTTSPDVTVSTNLGGWVNKRRLFHRNIAEDIFKAEKIPSAQIWRRGPDGQHIELGIAEHNLFLLLGQLGLSHDFFGERLLPIGTLYDPFINRGLDALNYACYQDARFMVVATPSGITLGPEGGAHQSIHPPVIAMAQPGLTYFEPTYADELAAAMKWGFEHMQAEDGGAVYLRLSTRAIAQERRDAVPDGAIRDGAYWLREPGEGSRLAICFAGVMAPEALEAWEDAKAIDPGAGLLAVTSPDRAHRGWTAGRKSRVRDEWTRPSAIDHLLSRLSPDAKLVTVIDGAPQALSWLGSVKGHQTTSLGVETFGQTGDLPDLYDAYGISAARIVQACEDAFLP
ncbi:MAG: hypothetical protein RIA71_15555 [Oceanicaulis sp.]